MSESKHIYIVYQTTNLVNQKFYIGVHKQDFFFPILFDGYLGSGPLLKKAIKKYGEENFNRETLFVYYTPEEAYTKEAELVNEAFVNRKDTYNLCGGGHGVSHFTEDHKKKLSESKKEYYKRVPIDQRRQSIVTRQKRSSSMSGKNNPRYGKQGTFKNKKHTEESKQKMSKIKSGKNHPQYGKPRSEKTKQKLSESAKNREKVKCPYCGKSGDISAMKRWHMNNCKFKSLFE